MADNKLLYRVEVETSNLYANGQIIYFPQDEEAILIRDILVFEPGDGDRYHPVKIGDRLDQLAWRYYKDEVPKPHKYWWAIADANLIFNPFDIRDWVGKELLIPDIQQVKLKVG